MRSVQEALTEILSHFETLPAESIPLEDALGRTLAENVAAVDDLPLFDNSSMDGYAVRAKDVENVPVRLPVVGDIPAGSYPEFSVQAGQAARIMTGAPVPQGANAIVPIEETDDLGDALPALVEIRKGSRQGAYIRPRGEDVKTGEVVLEKGHILRPQDLGLLGGLGITQVPVVRKPRVAILSTGDEILLAGEPVAPGKIRDMNSYSLRGMVQALGAEPFWLGIARDTAEDVRQKLQSALTQGADVILSTAGVSVGTRDVVKLVMEELGAIDFWRVNMRPGKPLAFGNVDGVPYFGLPGNPVSSLVSSELFVRPAILKLLGQPFHTLTYDVIVAEDMSSDGRESYIRVFVEREDGKLIARATGTQSSGAISSLVKADGLLIIPAGVTQVTAGDVLQVRPFAGQAIIK